jgi:hypothetical protein
MNGALPRHGLGGVLSDGRYGGGPGHLARPNGIDDSALSASRCVWSGFAIHNRHSGSLSLRSNAHGATGETDHGAHEMLNYRLLLIGAASTANRLELRRLI